MRFFGFFREQSNAMGSTLSIRDFIVGQRPDDARAAAYLRAGTVLLEADELVRDVLDPAAAVIGTLCLRSDGEWIWPDDLAHYTQVYGLRLPTELEARMRQASWICPVLAPADVERALSALGGRSL